MATTPDTPDVSELLPGGYPGTPQHEQIVDEDAANEELGNYVQKVKDALPSFLKTDNNNVGNGTENKESSGGYVEKIKESLPSLSLAGNSTDGGENKESGGYVEKIKESLPSLSLAGNSTDSTENKESRGVIDGAENKESRGVEDGAVNKESRGVEDGAVNKEPGYAEKIKESLPSLSLAGNSTDNTENKESKGVVDGAENKESGGYVEKIKESLPSLSLTGNSTDNTKNKESRGVVDGAENKESGYVEKIKESLPSLSLAGNSTENKESRGVVDGAENKESGGYVEKIKESLPSLPFAGNSTENKENKESENNTEKSRDDKIRESFPLRFEPNPSLKANDDNDLAKVTNQGSSALGGVGINPAAIIGIGSESPRHPYYRDHPPEAAGGEIDTSDTFDLTGDYNKQKEQEQIAEHKAQKQDKLDHKQKSEDKKREKPERIDLGVKPLVGQQPPLPYKPEEAAKDTDHIQQPPGKTTVVHPEGNVNPKVTKKDKVNATVGRAVGTLKQKIGKLVKNDSLVSKGTEEKVEAAEIQKKAKEF